MSSLGIEFEFKRMSARRTDDAMRRACNMH